MPLGVAPSQQLSLAGLPLLGGRQLLARRGQQLAPLPRVARQLRHAAVGAHLSAQGGGGVAKQLQQRGTGVGADLDSSSE